MPTTSHVVIGIGPDTRIAIDRSCPHQLEIGAPSGVLDLVLFASSSADLRRVAAAATRAAELVDLDAAWAEAVQLNEVWNAAEAWAEAEARRLEAEVTS